MQSLVDYQFIDIHYHANPDLYERRRSVLETGTIYKSLNGAVVLKSHLGSTAIQATIGQHMGLPTFPSLVLNQIAGGINYRVIMRALSEYQPVVPTKMIVHFPTITGRKIQSRLSRKIVHDSLSEYSLAGETLFDPTLKLRQEVIDILKMARDYPIVLSTGHACREEVFSLIEACIKYNVQALLLNQPANPMTGLNAAALEDLLHNKFIWVEQTALTHLLGHQDMDDFSRVLTHLPRVLYSSDLGQTSQMDIPDWMRYSENVFTELKLSDQRKNELMRLNALQLLSI